jgi:hypothetical protein
VPSVSGRRKWLPSDIDPKQIRFSIKENVKGYERAAFSKAWASYCSGARKRVGLEGRGVIEVYDTYNIVCEIS